VALAVLSDPADPYYTLAVDIASQERAPLVATPGEALALAPDFLIWVTSPDKLADASLVDYGKAVRLSGVTSAVGFISGSTLDDARGLCRRRFTAVSPRVALAFGDWRARAPHVVRVETNREWSEPLTIASFKRALQDSDVLVYEGHGGATYLRFDAVSSFTAADVARQAAPAIVSTYACNTFRIWQPRSVALAFTDHGAAAYLGYAYSPLPGYQMTSGLPLRHTWPGFPLGRLVQLQAAAAMEGIFNLPAYYMLGDPRQAVRTTPPYTVASDVRLVDSRTVNLADLPAGIVPIRVDGGAAYETTEVVGVTRVWQRDPFYNARLQVLDVGNDRYLLVQHEGGPISIRLATETPFVATAGQTALKGLDLCLIVYPSADVATCLLLSACSIGGLGWLAYRRRFTRRALLAACALAAAVLAAHVAYAVLRSGKVEAFSMPPEFHLHPWMFAVTSLLAAWGGMRFFLTTKSRGRILAVAIATVQNGWGPVCAWLGWPMLFNLRVLSRLGTGLYSPRAGVVTLVGGSVFTLAVLAALLLLRRLVAAPTSSSPSRSPAGPPRSCTQSP
jgi:hypothetical protein